MDVAPHVATEESPRSWTVPIVYVIVAVAAVVASHGHFPAVMAGGGVFAVWLFHTTLLFFERIDAVAEREETAGIAVLPAQLTAQLPTPRTHRGP